MRSEEGGDGLRNEYCDGTVGSCALRSKSMPGVPLLRYLPSSKVTLYRGTKHRVQVYDPETLYYDKPQRTTSEDGPMEDQKRRGEQGEHC